MLLSILIPTLNGRQKKFNALHASLMEQITRETLYGKIEIKHLRDKGEMTTGEKRNKLVGMARGEYVAFIDDDDLVAGDYVQEIYLRLQHKDIDVIGFRGLITFDGKYSKQFISSIGYNEYGVDKDGVYYRPPTHLNPIRKSIAVQVPYLETSEGEDSNYAIRLSRSGLVTREGFIDKVMYYYLFKSDKKRGE